MTNNTYRTLADRLRRWGARPDPITKVMHYDPKTHTLTEYQLKGK